MIYTKTGHSHYSPSLLTELIYIRLGGIMVGISSDNNYFNVETDSELSVDQKEELDYIFSNYDILCKEYFGTIDESKLNLTSLNNVLEKSVVNFTFNIQSSSIDKIYLRRNGVPSNEIPVLLPYSCSLAALSFMNVNKNVSGTIKIVSMAIDGTEKLYKYVHHFSNCKLFYLPNIIDVDFAQGEQIAVYLEMDYNMVANKPSVDLYFSINGGNYRTFFSNKGI